MNHIEFEDLVDNFEGRQSREINNKVKEHLAECDSCQNDATRLAEFFAYIRRELEPVPQATTARILNTYDRRPIVTEPIVKPERSGFLIFDDWTMAVGERRFTFDSRQMLYRVEGIDIDLRIEFSDDSCTISGQLLPGEPQASVRLSSPNYSASTTVNEFSEFELENLPLDVYDIHISSPSIKIDIEKVALQR